MNTKPHVLHARVYNDGLDPIQVLPLTTKLCEEISMQTQEIEGFPSLSPLEVAVELGLGNFVHYSAAGTFCYSLFSDWDEKSMIFRDRIAHENEKDENTQIERPTHAIELD